MRDADGKQDDGAVQAESPPGGVNASRPVAAGPRSGEAGLDLARFSLDQAPEAVFWVLADGRICYVNEAACRLVGYSRSELLAMSILDVDVGRVRDNRLEIWHQVQSQRRLTIESVGRAKSGRCFPVEVTVNRIRIAGHEYDCAFVRDITERKRSEDLLRVQRDLAVSLSETSDLKEALDCLLEAALRVGPYDAQGAYVVDPATGSQRLMSHRGVGPDIIDRVSMIPADAPGIEEVVNGRALYGLCGELAPHLREVFEQGGLRSAAILPLLHQGRLVASFCVASRSADEFPPHARHALETLAAQASGAVARLQAEEALSAREERLRAIADYTFDWENWIDPQGRPLWISPVVEAMTGYTIDELMRLDGFPLPLVAEEDRAEIEAEFAGAVGGTAGRDKVFRLRHKDGSLVWCMVSWQPIYDRQGRYQGHRSAIHDITARREAELLAQQRQAELARALRLSTVGEVASGLAHELNQPLGAICSYLDACRRLLESGAGAEALETLDKIASQARRASEVLRRIHGFVRRQPSERAGVDVNALIREAVSLIDAEVRSGRVALSLRLASELPPLRADDIQLQQVILNLIRNAIEAVVQAGAGPREVTVESALGDQGSVVIGVHDKGVGLTEESRRRLFEPFFSTKPNGMGLGLPISRSIVETHGGRLWAEPRPGGGASFFVSLPVRPGGDHG